MAPDERADVLAVDLAFDEALQHLSLARIAYEDDPRNPDLIAELGAARIRLEDARKAMNSERLRLTLKPRQLRNEPNPRADEPPMMGWQSIVSEG